MSPKKSAKKSKSAAKSRMKKPAARKPAPAKAKSKSAKASAPKGKAKAAASAKGVPEGFRTITPYLVVDGAESAIDFYRAAFGAIENMRMPAPGGGKIMHAELMIGDSKLMLADDFPEMQGGTSRSPLRIGNTPVTIHLYVANADDLVKRAVGAGCQVVMPVSDMFWGDRFGIVRDPYGHMWSIATNVKTLSPDEMGDAMAAAFAPSGGQCASF